MTSQRKVVDLPGWDEYLLKNTAPVRPEDSLPLSFGSKSDFDRISTIQLPMAERLVPNPLNVESLLDQAAELLDRALRIREKIDELRTSKFELHLDLEEFSALDRIHQLEIDSGRYSYEADEKAAEIRSLNSELKHLNESLTALSSFKAWFSSNDDLNPRIEEAALSAATAAYPIVDVQQEANKGSSRYQELARTARSVVESDIKHRWTMLVLQKIDLVRSIETARERLAAAESASKYLSVSKESQIDRAMVARCLFQEKHLESVRSGGILHYEERIKPLQESADRDLAHALLRMRACAEGLKQLFDYPASIPSEVNLDNCVAWVRDAINWLRTLVLWDSTSILTLSLRSLGKAAWETGLGRGTWQAVIGTDAEKSNVQIPANHVFPRIRSVKAYVCGTAAAEKKIWPIEVTLPRNDAVTIQWGQKSRRLVAQEKLPTVLLGNVMGQSVPRAPEPAGSPIWTNASPIGTWTVALAPRGDLVAAKERSELTDIILEISIDCHPFS